MGADLRAPSDPVSLGVVAISRSSAPPTSNSAALPPLRSPNGSASIHPRSNARLPGSAAGSGPGPRDGLQDACLLHHPGHLLRSFSPSGRSGARGGPPAQPIRSSAALQPTAPCAATISLCSGVSRPAAARPPAACPRGNAARASAHSAGAMFATPGCRRPRPAPAPCRAAHRCRRTGGSPVAGVGEVGEPLDVARRILEPDHVRVPHQLADEAGLQRDLRVLRDVVEQHRHGRRVRDGAEMVHQRGRRTEVRPEIRRRVHEHDVRALRGQLRACRAVARVDSPDAPAISGKPAGTTSRAKRGEPHLLVLVQQRALAVRAEQHDAVDRVSTQRRRFSRNGSARSRP
jgi:hypothetical protein